MVAPRPGPERLTNKAEANCAAQPGHAMTRSQDSEARAKLAVLAVVAWPENGRVIIGS
jgi:hypothetical protein